MLTLVLTRTEVKDQTSMVSGNESLVPETPKASGWTIAFLAALLGAALASEYLFPSSQERTNPRF